MEANGKADLKAPLLQVPNSASVSETKSINGKEKKIRTISFKEKEIKEAVEDAGFQVEEFPEQEIAVCRLRIKGMACTSCSESVEHALLMSNGVKKAVVGLAFEEAKVHFDPSLTDTAHIIEAVEDAGFGADLIASGNDANKVQLKLDGVNSTEDVANIEALLRALVGIDDVETDLTENKVTISYDPNLIDPRSFITCIEEAGGTNKYRASLLVLSGHRETEKLRESRMYRDQFLWSCVFSVPVFLFSMVLPMIPPYGNWLEYKLFNMLTIGMLLRWILCTPVQFIVGRRFYVGSYHALGTNSAYFYSVYVIVKAATSSAFEGQDFFETSVMLISFILLGKYLEILAKGRTSDALAKLTDLTPDTAALLTFDADGNIISEMEINTQLIQKGDIIKIIPGVKVPVDGIVIDGQSHVNESMITGEAKPIAKRPGDKVIGGTMNENGCILVKATHVGSETALSQIVQLVEAAQLSKAPVQKLADQISKFFVPMVVVAAFVTWLGWFIPGEADLYPKSWIPEAMDAFELALQFGISVLVVACPCALGLATPTAVMVLPQERVLHKVYLLRVEMRLRKHTRFFLTLNALEGKDASLSHKTREFSSPGEATSSGELIRRKRQKVELARRSHFARRANQKQKSRDSTSPGEVTSPGELPECRTPVTSARQAKLLRQARSRRISYFS